MKIADLNMKLTMIRLFCRLRLLHGSSDRHSWFAGFIGYCALPHHHLAGTYNTHALTDTAPLSVEFIFIRKLRWSSLRNYSVNVYEPDADPFTENPSLLYIFSISLRFQSESSTSCAKTDCSYSERLRLYFAFRDRKGYDNWLLLPYGLYSCLRRRMIFRSAYQYP